MSSGAAFSSQRGSIDENPKVPDEQEYVDSTINQYYNTGGNKTSKYGINEFTTPIKNTGPSKLRSTYQNAKPPSAA